MQDEIHIQASLATEGRVANVTLDEGEACPLPGGNDALHLREIPAMAAAEIVQADDALIQFEQRLQQIRPNETAGARDQPSPRFALEQIDKIGGKRLHGRERRQRAVIT